MEANEILELARKAYPNDENLRVAYILGLQKGAENLEEAVNDAKDLDIEKTLNGFQNFYAHENSGEFPSAIEIARHFYELGLQVNNPVTAADRGFAEEIIINLKRVENDYHLDLTREMEWLRNKAMKGE